MKPRKCKACKQTFIPERSFQPCCGYDCAILYARERTAKEKSSDKRRAIKDFKAQDKPTLTKLAQQVFNKYVRLRDGKVCISCGNTTRQMHAGHFRPVGRNHALRFDEDNCHTQCSICNNHLSGNLILYREALIEKIGEEKVVKLEETNYPYSYQVEELQEIIDSYKLKIKTMVS